MAIGTAAGHPQYSGIFIPEVWSGKLIEKFYLATVFGDIANTDYEGEVKKQGDKVNIRTTPSITIRDYKKGQTLQVERPESDMVELLIDRAKYFNFVVDSVDAYQSDINIMNAWSNDAGEQMKIAVDSEILGEFYADADAANIGTAAGKDSGSFNLGTTGTPIQITKANILDYVVDCGTILDEQNVPESNRWMLLPAWACGLLKKSDLKDASLTGDGSSVLRNGRLGMIDRFTLYSSNNLPKITDTGHTCVPMPFGHKSALTFAANMTEMDTLKAESTFGQLVRGLNVFGFEVVKPEAMGYVYGYK